MTSPSLRRLLAGPLASLLAVLALLLLWEVFAAAGLVNPIFFPPPSTIARTLVRLLAEGRLGPAVAATLGRVLGGFLLGAVPAFLLGLLMGRSDPLRRAVDPLVASLHPIPKIAILPLFMVVFGIGETSRLAMVALASFFPMLLNTVAGVRQISPIYLDVARNFGVGGLRLLSRVVIPGSLPLVLTGIRISLNMAFLITIAVELVAADRGLGSLIWFAWETFRTEELYAAVAVIALLGVGLSGLVHLAFRFLVPWQAGH